MIAEVTDCMDNNTSSKKILNLLLTSAAFIMLAAATVLYSGSGSSADTDPQSTAPPDYTPPVVSSSQIAERTAEPESLSLSGSTQFIAEGSTMQLEAQPVPADAQTGTIIWSSSDPSVAAVSESGTLTANAKGEATVTACAENGVAGYYKIKVIPSATVYLSPSADSRDYAAGDTTEAAQSRIISEHCKVRLTAAGLNVIIAEDELTLKKRAREANENKADYYIAVHTADTEKDGAQVAFNRRVSDSIRLSVYIKDGLAGVLATESKGTVVSGINLGIEELEHPEKYDIPAVLVEAQSHGTQENALWIIENAGAIGYAIADGFMNFLLNDID